MTMLAVFPFPVSHVFGTSHFLFQSVKAQLLHECGGVCCLLSISSSVNLLSTANIVMYKQAKNLDYIAKQDL